MKPKPANRTPFLERFQNWAAIMSAGVTTFFVHPFVYGASMNFVRDFGQEHYRAGAVIPFFWWVLTFAGMIALLGVILKVLFAGGVISLIRRFA